MALTHAETGNLVAALLAVNFFPLDRAHAMMPAFESRGLLDPQHVAALSQADLIRMMAEAGYDRGGYLPILSFRLFTLMEAISSGSLDVLRAHAHRGDRPAFISALSTVKGFGPVTAGAAWELWDKP